MYSIEKYIKSAKLYRINMSKVEKKLLFMIHIHTVSEDVEDVSIIVIIAPVLC